MSFQPLGSAGDALPPVFNPEPITDLYVQLGSSPDIMAELIDGYRRETAIRTAGLRDAALRGDLTALQRDAHALKSSAAQFGLERLHHQLVAAERDAKAGKAESLNDIPELLAQAGDALAALEAWWASVSGHAP